MNWELILVAFAIFWAGGRIARAIEKATTELHMRNSLAVLVRGSRPGVRRTALHDGPRKSP